MAINDPSELDELELLKESIRQRQMNKPSPVGESNPLRDILIGVGSLGYGLGTGQSAPALAQGIFDKRNAQEENARKIAALEAEKQISALTDLSKQRLKSKSDKENLMLRAQLDLNRQLEYGRLMGANQQQLEQMRQAGQAAIRKTIGEQALGLQKLKGEQELEQIKAKPIAQKKAGGAASSSTVIPGYEISQGAEPTKEDVKKVKQSAVAFNRFEKALDALESAVKKYGVRSLPFSEGRAEIERAASQVVIEGKEAANLGALAGPDMNIILSSIGSPTSAKTAVLGDQEYLNLLRNAKQSAINQHDATVSVYGFKRAGGAQAAPSSGGSSIKDRAKAILEKRRGAK